jgi:hypothetical protein
MTHAGNSMFGGDDDDDDSGVATMEREERKEEYIAQWPNKQYIAETLKQFPDAGIASVEQARVCSRRQPGRPPSVMGSMTCYSNIAGYHVGTWASSTNVCSHSSGIVLRGRIHIPRRPASAGV